MYERRGISSMIEESNFVKSIKGDFCSDPKESLLDALFYEYERVVFKSIITAFGLDLFIVDQYGGDVDTIHNVSSITDDPDSKMRYKHKSNESAYNDREPYSHKLGEGEGTNYQKIRAQARDYYREDIRNHTVRDAYEDKPLGFLGKSKGHPTDKNAEIDHVISVKTIYDDRGRVLAGISTEELADDIDNLKWTNEHLNKSMGASEIPEYIKQHPELSEDVKNRMMDSYNQARASYEKKINHRYYFDFSNHNCREFYRQSAKAAGKRGVQMGLRQAVGVLMTELWFDVKDELNNSDGTLLDSFRAVKKGLKKWGMDVKNNYKSIAIQFGEGVISGIISSVTSTLTNIFITTSENIVHIIRQTWASIVEATSILLFNSREKYFCDRMTSAAKVLATGASMIVGTQVQQNIQMNLLRLHLSKEMINTISTFAGCLSTGILSISLLFYIDNDPFGKFFDTVYGEKVEILKKQGEAFKKYCAELEHIDTKDFEYATNYAYRLSCDLEKAENTQQMNQILRRAVSDLGLSSLWGEGSLVEKLKNPNWKLQF